VALDEVRRQEFFRAGAVMRAYARGKPEMEKLGDTLVNHFDGIAAYCNHPVRFGVVESLNTTIKGVLRRARGIGDEAILLLKLKWASATPIRSSRDLTQFLQPIRGIS
jgi:transposase